MQAMAAQAKTHPSPTRSTVKTQENIMIMIMHSTAQHLRKSINSIMKFSQIDESPSLMIQSAESQPSLSTGGSYSLYILWNTSWVKGYFLLCYEIIKCFNQIKNIL